MYTYSTFLKKRMILKVTMWIGLTLMLSWMTTVMGERAGLLAMMVGSPRLPGQS